MNATATIKIRATVTHRTRSAKYSPSRQMRKSVSANAILRWNLDCCLKDGAQSRSLVFPDVARLVLRRLSR